MNYYTSAESYVGVLYGCEFFRVTIKEIGEYYGNIYRAYHTRNFFLLNFGQTFSFFYYGAYSKISTIIFV